MAQPRAEPHLSIDKSKVVGASESDLAEFTCGICLGIFNEPVVTLCCSQIYCRQCLLIWLTNESTCPNDRQFLTNKDLVPAPRPLLNLLDNLKVKCNYEELGCSQVVRIGDLSHHLKVCDVRPDKPCGTCGLTKDGEQHICLTSLLDENRRLNDENKRLFDENMSLVLENKNKISWSDIFSLSMISSRPTLAHVLIILVVLLMILSGKFSERNEVQNQIFF